MLDEIFSGTKLALAKLFVQQEALAYGRNWSKESQQELSKLRAAGDWHPKNFVPTLGEEGKKWCEIVENKIVAEFKEKCPDGADWITFNSYGNAGALEHSITIYGKKPYWNWQKSSVSVDFCTCGDTDHWGSITVLSPDRKSAG